MEKVKTFLQSHFNKDKLLFYKIPKYNDVFMRIINFCYILLIVFFIWLTSYFIVLSMFDLNTSNELFLPNFKNNYVYSLILVVYLAYMFGFFLNLILNFPPLLGMLIIGFVFQNVELINVNFNEKWSAMLRNIALSTILLRAGMGLNLKALRRLGISTFLLTVLPGISECLTTAIISKFAFNLPWIWGFVIGSVLAAVSPAVVVPSLLSLQDRKYGTKKGIPTMVLAAAGFDDVIAITAFGVFVGIAFQSDDSIVLQIFHGPIEIVSGILIGLLGGFCYSPLYFLKNSFQKFILIYLTGITQGIFGALIGFSGAGALSSMTMACFLAQIWKDIKKVKDYLSYIWIVAQPILFSLIGSAVSISSLTPELIGIGILVILSGIIVRVTATFIALTKSGLNF